MRVVLGVRSCFGMPLYSLMLLLLFHTDGACPCAAWYRTHRAGCAGGADNFPASAASAQAQAECEQSGCSGCQQVYAVCN
jgi:hypothetical protein